MLLKGFFSTLFISLSILAFAQDTVQTATDSSAVEQIAEPEKPNKEKKIRTDVPLSFGLNLSPEISTLSVPNRDLQYDSWDATGSFSYSVGLAIEYKIKNRARFETGIEYGKKAFGITIDSMVVQTADPNDAEYIVTANTSHSYVYDQIGIPVIIKYDLLDGKISLEGNAGVHYFINGGLDIKRNYMEGTSEDISNILDNSVFFSAGLGVTYHQSLTKTLTLNATPTVRLFTGSQAYIWRDLQFYNIGLKVGLMFDPRPKTESAEF